MTDVWAQLVSTTDIEMEHIQLTKNKITIGRNRGSDICLSEKIFVSGNHCFIERDPETGIVWLHDTSTNGTFMNGVEKLVHQKAQLNHGDEIYIVNLEADSVHNVAFIFQDMEELKREETTSSSSLPSGDMNQTYTYNATFEDCSPNHRLRKRELSVYDRTEPDSKHHKGSGTSVGVAPRVPGSLSASTDKPRATSSFTGDVVDVTSGIQPVESLAATASGSILSAKNFLSTDGTQSSSEPVTQAAEPFQEVSQRSDTPTSTSYSQDDAKPSTSNLSDPCKVSLSDEMLDSLMCVICQEILYKCVSTQPCLHSFCAGCYSDWMHQSSVCPSCRVEVERVRKNHLVNNLVEAYLNAIPEKRRSAEELKELDAKSKILDEVLASPVMSQTDVENVEKCKNFFSTLLRLASQQPAEMLDTIKKLVQNLVDSVSEPEEFTAELQKVLKSSPQPYLVTFLKKNVPFLRLSLSLHKVRIDGIRAPPQPRMSGAATSHAGILITSASRQEWRR